MMRFSRGIAMACAIGTAVCANATCWKSAAATYTVDQALLQAIAWQESRGRPAAIGPLLPDGNRALGLMQINTIHLPSLKPYGIAREHLFDACTSITVGAWVLRDCIDRFGESWYAVGCYYAGPNSKAFAKMSSYVADVQRHYAGYAQDEQAMQQSMSLNR
jgi:soluble lytic murein transglycosylase-like protein